MRLTNVAHLRLPFGPLWTYRLEVGSPGAALPLSADQARHVGEGPRAGSWMALALRLPAPVQREVLSRAWHAVVERHGTLRTVALLDDDGVPSLHEVPVLGGAWVEHPVRAGQPMHVAVRRLLDEACSPEQTPSHRLSVIETMDGPVVLIASDHAHVDMWSFLVLLRDLLDAVQALREGRDPALGTAPSFGEHTVLQAERPAPSPEEAARWHGMLQECGGHFPVFPLPLGADSPVPERVEVRDVLDVVGNEALADAAAGQGVSSLALVVSVLAEVTGRLAGSPLRALFPPCTRGWIRAGTTRWAGSSRTPCSPPRPPAPRTRPPPCGRPCASDVRASTRCCPATPTPAPSPACSPSPGWTCAGCRWRWTRGGCRPSW